MGRPGRRTARVCREPVRDESGFTLIELLVVIIIIGILAAIAIPVYLHQRTKGYEASEKSDLHTVAYEIESYYATTDDYTSVPFGSATGAATTPTISGTANVGGDSMTLSKGNTATLLAAGVNGYCIGITNSTIGSSVKTWYFDSLGGGLTKTACSATSRNY
jgi:type IV pilus assembly protein PilA